MFNRYFQDELSFLRELGREFASAYPALAPMLADRSADPDVERLLEGVAFLTSRVRQKLDDELPEAIHGIARLLFPSLVSPVAATAILEVVPLPGALRERVTVAKGVEFASVDVDGERCRFTSSRALELCPWVLDEARIEMATNGRQQLRLEISVPQGMPLAQVGSDRLRVHFSGEVPTAMGMVAWLVEHAEAVTVSFGDRNVELGKQSVHHVGLEEDDELLPKAASSFPGFRILEEYHVLPAKFAFVDFAGLMRVFESEPKASRFALTVRFDAMLPPEVRATRELFKLHCVPIVNIFPTTTEPLRLGPDHEEYLLRAAGLSPAHGEVYSILKVQAIERGTSARIEIPSFYDFSHLRTAHTGAFYVPQLRPAVVGEGVETLVSFGTTKDGGEMPDADVVSVEILGTNGALASALRPGEIRVATPTSPAFATFRNLTAPTQHVPPPLGRELQWRMVAHAAMSLRAMTDLPVLRTALDVYNRLALVDQQAVRAGELRASSITSVAAKKDEALVRGALVRGVAIEVDLEERGFSGVGDLWLFGAVLDRMFGSYVSLNSYSRTTVRGVTSKHVFAWPPRNGSLSLL